MVVALKLNAEEVQALHRTAEAAGVDIDAVLHQLIALLAPEAIENAPARREPSEMDSAEGAAGEGAAGAEAAEEEAERRREQEEMQANIRRWHAEQRGSASAPSG